MDVDHRHINLFTYLDLWGIEGERGGIVMLREVPFLIGTREGIVGFLVEDVVFLMG